MAFTVSTFKKASNEIALGRNLGLANWANPSQFVGVVGVAMRTAKNMAYPVALAGVQSRFYLFIGG